MLRKQGGRKNKMERERERERERRESSPAHSPINLLNNAMTNRFSDTVVCSSLYILEIITPIVSSNTVSYLAPLITTPTSTKMIIKRANSQRTKKKLVNMQMAE
jgi:hypothetical protein